MTTAKIMKKRRKTLRRKLSNLASVCFLVRPSAHDSVLENVLEECNRDILRTTDQKTRYFKRERKGKKTRLSTNSTTFKISRFHGRKQTNTKTSSRETKASPRTAKDTTMKAFFLILVFLMVHVMVTQGREVGDQHYFPDDPDYWRTSTEGSIRVVANGDHKPVPSAFPANPNFPIYQ